MAISRALDGIPAEIFFASDQSDVIQPGDLLKKSYRGGYDNEPALYAALQRARQQPGSAILWLHASQATQLTRQERLMQLLERGARPVPFYAATMSDGPNRLLELIGGKGRVQMLPVHITRRDALREWMRSKLQAASKDQWEFSRTEVPPADPAVETSDQLARFWAMQEVEKTNEGTLAARYQLVTHVSGAVVLENADQYARHGLEQVDASSTPVIPNIPEPSSSLLILTSITALMLRRKVTR